MADTNAATLTNSVVKEEHHPMTMRDDNSGFHPIKVGDADHFEIPDVDKTIERRIVRKFDLYVLPLLSIMYLFNSLDKSNLGIAKTGGLEEDLGLVGNQYNIILSVFYVPFVLCGPPMNLLTKRFGAKVVLPISMLFFGSMAMLSAATVNFGGILTTRWFLGMAESGFFAGVIYYLTTFYKRTELASRLCIFYAMAQIAGAFGGLIAYGVFQIRGSLHKWQYLFLVEGSLTVMGAAIIYPLLPKSAATARFLTEEEKRVAFRRIAVDSSVVVDVKFSFSSAVQVFKEDRLWPFYTIISVCVGVPLFSVANFLPQIVARLGYNAVKTNLYTIAPNLVGANFLIAIAFSSDYWRDRSLHLAICLLTTCVGFVILAAVNFSKHLAVGYFACFLISAGGFVTSPLLSTWYNNNTPDENKRAFLTPVIISIGNTMGLVSSNIFTPASAPSYTMASIISACFGFVGACTALGIGLYMRHDNRKRNLAQGVNLKAEDISTSELALGQKSLYWRWMGGVQF